MLLVFRERATLLSLTALTVLFVFNVAPRVLGTHADSLPARRSERKRALVPPKVKHSTDAFSFVFTILHTFNVADLIYFTWNVRLLLHPPSVI